jgi:hypothetical protein
MPSAQPEPVDVDDACEETLAGEDALCEAAGASPPAPASPARPDFYDAPISDAELAELLGDDAREPEAAKAFDKAARLALIKARHRIYLARRAAAQAEEATGGVEDLCDVLSTLERAKPGVLEDDQADDEQRVEDSGSSVALELDEDLDEALPGGLP